MAKSTWADGDTFHASDQNAIATEVTSDTTAIGAIQAISGLIKGNGAGTYTAVGTPLSVANGGTGAATLTGLVKGNGTSAMTAAVAGTDYVSPSSTETQTNKTLTNPTINGYTEGVQALGVVTTTKTIPALTNGTVVTATLTASTTCAFTQPTMAAGQSYTLYLKQPATTGNGAATFSGVKWPGGVAPTITATAGQMDKLSFESDGTDIFGSYVQGYTY